MTDVDKPSDGPWEVGCGYGRYGVQIVSGDGSYAVCSVAYVEKDIKDKDGKVIGTERIERAWADVSLIMQAGTVYHETGRTPRQLAEQRDELLKALKELSHWFPPDSALDSAGYTADETNAASDSYEAANAIIAKVEDKP